MKKPSQIIIVVIAAGLLLAVGYFWNNGLKPQPCVTGSLEQMLRSRDSAESVILYSLDDIDRRLDSIRDDEGYLVIGPNSNFDGIRSKREQIIGNITMIRNIISDNKTKIRGLEKDLKRIKSGNKALADKLASYRERSDEMLAELNKLRYELEEEKLTLAHEQHRSEVLARRVIGQTIDYARLKENYDKVEAEAYTGYYIAGSKSQLRELNVLKKPKLPISFVSARPQSYLPSEEFEKLDIRDETIIPVHSPRAELLTPHSKQAYVWMDDEEGMKNLCITNPSVFWQSSKYLVIETK